MNKNESIKEFFGSVSFTGRVNFTINAKNKDEAKNFVFEDIEGLEITLKDKSPIQIQEIEWDLIIKTQGGNVSETYVNDFDINEER